MYIEKNVFMLFFQLGMFLMFCWTIILLIVELFK